MSPGFIRAFFAAICLLAGLQALHGRTITATIFQVADATAPPKPGDLVPARSYRFLGIGSDGFTTYGFDEKALGVEIRTSEGSTSTISTYTTTDPTWTGILAVKSDEYHLSWSYPLPTATTTVPGGSFGRIFDCTGDTSGTGDCVMVGWGPAGTGRPKSSVSTATNTFKATFVPFQTLTVEVKDGKENTARSAGITTFCISTVTFFVVLGGLLL